ncbi:receptor-transporting protein 2-like [Megalobrama amblycephala]|uniref:receptor-transporting protein 2-like n=1 Tax=Megalobrama amblycephala TaxID=75352 RepID=UPI002014536F|nr:receptor-transporting protein 2-like [Megalobrama amblycephala]
MALMLWESSLQAKASELHGDTWHITINESIEPHKQACDWHQYISGSFARFECSLCRRTWMSKRVQVVFHFHLDTARKQGNIKLRRFKQMCRRCNEAQMEDPNFPVENIDVLIGRLVEKIRVRCYKENLGEKNRPSVFNGRVNGPHESAHCEACRLGVCSQAN